MTELEHAIKHIKTRADAWAVKEVTEALQSISERLDKALSQEPCESINKTYEFGKNKGVAVYWNKQTDTVELPEAVFRYILSLVPTVNPQPSEHFIDGVHAMGYREGYKDAQKQKSGKWIGTNTQDEMIGEVFKCAQCGEDFIKDYNYNYCPNCGCKMESESDA